MGIDQICDRVIREVEHLREAHKGECARNAGAPLPAARTDSERVQALNQVIREAVSKLESTKHSFKSRQVREVREQLLNAIDS